LDARGTNETEPSRYCVPKKIFDVIHKEENDGRPMKYGLFKTGFTQILVLVTPMACFGGY